MYYLIAFRYLRMSRLFLIYTLEHSPRHRRLELPIPPFGYRFPYRRRQLCKSARMQSSDRSRLFLNCSFSSQDEHYAWLEKALREDTLHHIVTLNAEMVLEAEKNQAFRNSVLRAERTIPDGSSILWAREYLERYPARSAWIPAYARMTVSFFKFFFSKQKTLTGVDTIFDICSVLAKMQGVIYLLGGEEADRTKTAEILRKKYPDLAVQILEETAIPNLSSPSALFVALGSPKQTLWIEEHREELVRAGVRIAMGVGGAFAMISGRLPRAPRFFRIHHIEWLWRLFLEPNRMKRIWNAVVVFPRHIAGYPH